MTHIPDSIGIMLLALCAFFFALLSGGCGSPSLDDFLKNKKIVCDIKVTLPENRIRGPEVDLSGVILENCKEIK